MVLCVGLAYPEAGAESERTMSGTPMLVSLAMKVTAVGQAGRGPSRCGDRLRDEEVVS
jgi:hypothetical protein